MNIQLVSSSISQDDLASTRALINAYFPQAAIKILTGTDFLTPDHLRSASQKPDHLGKGQRKDEGDAQKYVLGLELENATLGPIRASWSGYLRPGAHSPERSEVGVTEVTFNEEEIQKIMAQPMLGRESFLRLTLKHTLFKLFVKVTGRVLPWGVLTGIRPSKILHRLDDMKITKKVQKDVLRYRYAVSLEKIELLQKIVAVQRPYLENIRENPKSVAVYVGIPFCPTRCTYCSFPGYSLSRERQEMMMYLQTLRQEIVRVGQMMRSLGLKADNLYIGGGTPTILTAKELEQLLEVLRAHIPVEKDLEFSVEAGRPDTLTLEKLELLAQWKISRLSINPQTMHNQTLKRIGRAHNVHEVVEAYQAARRLADWVINMDLILGLPGEGIAEVRTTLEKIASLQPDNLTVHALALKRGSLEHEMGLRHVEDTIADKMQALAEEFSARWGLRPYYLYRQKHMAGNLENIGYAKRGRECRYNIAIMEERQNIIGIGAGASTKVVHPEDYTLENFQHPSNWLSYLNSWTRVQEKREEMLTRMY